MAGGRASPAAERKRIGAAYAWFEKRVAPTAGTGQAVARTTPRYMRDPAQFDCFDKTHNATELLALLEYYGFATAPRDRRAAVAGARVRTH
jgi:hypothetical protein